MTDMFLGVLIGILANTLVRIIVDITINRRDKEAENERI